MNVICPKCNKKLAEVQSDTRLNMQVHCPFDGFDFGVTVDTPVPVEGKPATPASNAPPA